MPPSAPIPTLEPVLHLRWPDAAGTPSFAFAPDDRSVYVQLSYLVVDLWALAVIHWKYALGAPAVLLILAAVFMAVRVWRRPRRAGAAYCRRCNYDVTGLTGACPECGCGGDAYAGHSAPRRLAVPALLFAIATGGYGLMYLVPATSWDAVRMWAFLPSERVFRWGGLKPPRWLRGAWSMKETIVEIELPGGRTRRTVSSGRGALFPLLISPDGTQLLRRSAAAPECIATVDIRSGQETARAPLPGEIPLWLWADGKIEFSPDGMLAFVPWHNNRENRVGVSAWKLGAPTVFPLVDTVAPELPGEPRLSQPLRFTTLVRGDGSRFLTFPTIRMSNLHSDASAGIFEVGGVDPEPVPGQEWVPTRWLSSSASGVEVVYWNEFRGGLEWVELRSGASKGSLPMKDPPISQGTTIYMGIGRRLLYVPVVASPIPVIDVADRRIVAVLATPSGAVRPRLGDSPSGRWAGAGFAIRRDPELASDASTCELAVWDVSSLVPTSGE